MKEERCIGVWWLFVFCMGNSVMYQIIIIILKMIRKLHFVFLKKLTTFLIPDIGVGLYVAGRIHFSCSQYIHIGDNVSFGDGVYLMASDQGEIFIESECAIASGVRFVTQTHDYHVLPVRDVTISKPIVIEKYVWIGTAAIILPGITVGEGAVVAAGAVVTKNIPKNVVVAGNPARVINTISRSG